MEKLRQMEPFQSLELNVKEVLRYRYMIVRFGRVSLDYFHKLEKYLFDDLNAVFWKDQEMKIMYMDATLRRTRRLEK